MDAIIHPPPIDKIGSVEYNGPLYKPDEVERLKQVLGNKPVNWEHDYTKSEIGRVKPGSVRVGPLGQLIATLEVDRERGKHAIDKINSGQAKGVSISSFFLQRIDPDTKLPINYGLAPYEVSLCEQGDFPESGIVKCTDGKKKSYFREGLLKAIGGHTSKSSKMSEQTTQEPAAEPAPAAAPMEVEQDEEKIALRKQNEELAQIAQNYMKPAVTRCMESLNGVIDPQEETAVRDFLTKGLAHPNAPEVLTAMASLAERAKQGNSYQEYRTKYEQIVKEHDELLRASKNRVVDVNEMAPRPEERKKKARFGFTVDDLIENSVKHATAAVLTAQASANSAPLPATPVTAPAPVDVAPPPPPSAPSYSLNFKTLKSKAAVAFAPKNENNNNNSTEIDS